MIRLCALSLAVICTGVLVSGAPARAQGYSWGGNAGNRTPARPGQEVGDAVQGFLSGAQQICARVPDPAYTVDCLADYYDWLANNLPQTPGLSEARAIARNAADRLNRVARANASPTKPTAVLRENRSASARSTSRPVVPVDPARQDAVRAAARAIVQETQTELLRAAERSADRKLAFRQIAAAVGESSAILLRAG